MKFREQLTEAKLIRPLFDKFEEYLKGKGFEAAKGQIIDATIIETPVQHNSGKESEQIKNGETPDEWGKAKVSQKDTDARWTKKGSKSYYGYKDHVNVDAEHKIIRQYEVTATKGNRGKALNEEENAKNREKSRIRCRVEHVFGSMYQKRETM